METLVESPIEREYTGRIDRILDTFTRHHRFYFLLLEILLRRTIKPTVILHRQGSPNSICNFEFS
jgi:hypothetical protein